MSYWHKEQHGRILEVCEAKETRHWKKNVELRVDEMTENAKL